MSDHSWGVEDEVSTNYNGQESVGDTIILVFLNVLIMQTRVRASMLTLLARPTLWKTKNSLSWFSGTTYIGIQHTDQINYIFNQLQPTHVGYPVQALRSWSVLRTRICWDTVRRWLGGRRASMTFRAQMLDKTRMLFFNTLFACVLAFVSHFWLF
jgi:hypothetical protein